MKAYFDDKGTLCIDAEDNTEMVALKTWVETTETSPLIRSNAHLKTERTVIASPAS